MKGCLLLFLFLAKIYGAPETSFEYSEGGIIRGPKDKKQIALEFTAGEFAEGGKTILDELNRRHLKASFFFTGAFFRKPEYKTLGERIVKEGHYLGPHSDTHPLYCPWDGPKKTLVTKEFFLSDLEKNLKQIEACGVKRAQIKYFIPPYEQYNQQIVDWSHELGLTLINFSPGTRSNADYTEDGAKNFVSSQIIFESILKKEKEEGLNGFLLLLHFGVGPNRSDKMANRLGELLDILQGQG
ncbi:MAG: polysaccharide deacetylase family protein, partial [Verrucomicrobiota bacterium]|nr:polysaccharide deacetylase family protein [Verrucomicrobiota bacterium]